jgi:hypothetical protein
MDITEDILYFANRYINTCVYLYLTRTNGSPEHLVLFRSSPAPRMHDWRQGPRSTHCSAPVTMPGYVLLYGEVQHSVLSWFCSLKWINALFWCMNSPHGLAGLLSCLPLPRELI